MSITDKQREARRKGGASTSDAKAAAVRLNGAKGGRPRKSPAPVLVGAPGERPRKVWRVPAPPPAPPPPSTAPLWQRLAAALRAARRPLTLAELAPVARDGAERERFCAEFRRRPEVFVAVPFDHRFGFATGEPGAHASAGDRWTINPAYKPSGETVHEIRRAAGKLGGLTKAANAAARLNRRRRV